MIDSSVVRALGTGPGRDRDLEPVRYVGRPDPGTIAIEVELTQKSPRGLEGILRAWCRTGWVKEIHYHCEPGPTRRAVERAVGRARAGNKIVIGKAVAR